MRESSANVSTLDGVVPSVQKFNVVYNDEDPLQNEISIYPADDQNFNLLLNHAKQYMALNDSNVLVSFSIENETDLIV